MLNIKVFVQKLTTVLKKQWRRKQFKSGRGDRHLKKSCQAKKKKEKKKGFAYGYV